MARSLHRPFARLRCLAVLLPPLLILSMPAPAQQQEQKLPSAPRGIVTIILDAASLDSLLRLPHKFIVEGSDTLVLDSARILQRGKEYRLNTRNGTVALDSLLAAALAADTSRTRYALTVVYRYLPFQFQDAYARRQMVVLKDTAAGDTVRVARQQPSLSVEDLFGPNLQKSGSLVRGFTVGTNRDLSLTSGLRLQLAGSIATDLDVAAVLTDENTPIQPEGTTQSLQEFEKVFVELKGRDFATVLGDFNLNLAGGEFSTVNRKLQGGLGTLRYRVGPGMGSATASGAISRGKFNTNQFNGIEAVQGPYRLTSREGRSFIIVIAGTERVYIDGRPQVRGETNDYIIDYSTGELTFSNRRMITAASRITVDFEYTDQAYSRSMIAVQNSAGLLGDAAKLSVSYVREADDPDAPVDFELSDSAQAALRAAGNDREKAVISGVQQVDSNGTYKRIDTLLAGGQSAQFYRYAPGDPEARYRVAFSFAGTGKGEYVRETVGIFVWRGPGGGDYLPVIYVPLPQSHQVFDVSLAVSPAEQLTITGEYGRSLFDANRVSALEDDQNGGNAYTIGVKLSPKDIRIGSASLGSLDLSYRERFVEGSFVFIDRVNDIEFNRKWGIDSLASADERIREAALMYQPLAGLAVHGGYGRISRGEGFLSTRMDGHLVLQRQELPQGDYFIEQIDSREEAAGGASSWLRQRGYLEYGFWHVLPFARLEAENREVTLLSASLPAPGSFRFTDYGGGVKSRDLGKLQLSAEYGVRTDETFLSGSVVPQSVSSTQFYAAQVTDWNALSASVDVTLRDRVFTHEFQQQGFADIQTVLGRSRIRYAPLNQGLDADLYYEVGTEQSSRLQRVFVRVAPGQGNYRYAGDLNNNGVADDEEFVQTRFDGEYVALTLPTDQLTPIIDVKTSARLRISPRRFLEAGGWLTDALSAITTDTYFRIEERSTESDLRSIYLLDLSKFQQDSTTINGVMLFTQDLLFFDGSPKFSSRLRYSQRRGLSNFTSGAERSFGRELSARLRWQMVSQLSYQVDVVQRIDRLTGSPVATRVRDILSNDLTFDFSYRPQQNVELGLALRVSRSTDRNAQPETRADLNTQGVRWVFSFQGAGQARVEASREEVVLRSAVDTFPYELTGGRIPGTTWLWRTAFDYRLTQFIQATVAYDGRSEGGAAPVHTGRAELRAFF